jgi:hypothetical protein
MRAYPVGHALHSATDDCKTVVEVFFSVAATKCIRQCKGISGSITTFTPDPTYLDDEVVIPIDAFLLGLT